MKGKEKWNEATGKHLMSQFYTAPTLTQGAAALL